MFCVLAVWIFSARLRGMWLWGGAFKMCGIAGIVQRGAAVDAADLGRMAGVLGHRGPDARGHLLLGNVGLAHTRLALLGLGEVGAQPMRHPGGAWAITYNGEIFNHSTLRASPPGIGRMPGGSDTESLLDSLAVRGVEATLPGLDGFFAFAALDHRARTLHLVRDACGVKPLYYAAAGDRFYFASEAKAIFSAGFTAEPDLDVLRHHIVNRWCHGRATPFAGVSKLMPGERLEVDIDSLEIRRQQWNVAGDSVDTGWAEELAAMPGDALVDLVEGRLRDAVRGRLLADVPVATLCSGGIDSSLITAFAAAECADLHAFVIRPTADRESDESPYAQAVCDHVGATLHRVPFDASSWRRVFLESVSHMENPLWLEASMGQAVVAEAIRAAGFKAALGGDAADELFGGYDDRYPAERLAFAAQVGRQHPPLTIDFSCMPIESDLSRALRHPGEAPATEREYLAELHAAAGDACAHHDGARRELEMLLLAEKGMHMAVSFDQIDKVTMRSSLEYREPFLASELVRLAANLPLECKLWPQTKGVLRAVAARHLPDAVIKRKKIGFTFNTDRLFKDCVRPSFFASTMLEELFEVPNKKIAKWFEPDRGRATFRICSAEIWMRHFIAGQEIGEIGEALWLD